MSAQPSILSSVPAHASFLFLDLRHGREAADGLAQLQSICQHDWAVFGLGFGLLSGLGAVVPGLRLLPALTGAGVSSPSTPSDLLIRVTGPDPGKVLLRERHVLSGLSAFEVVDQVSGFMHGESRDLSGYEDGTENPTGDAASRVALQTGEPGLAGSSVVAVQRWVHDLDAFDALGRPAQDHAIGRDRDSNDELADAPESAHVKRTAQENFEPEAFTVRRSMPWRDHRGAGLVFVSFSATLDPFEAQLRRMLGLDDGIVDALFSFTRPVTGGAWWCPPLHDGRLDLRVCTRG